MLPKVHSCRAILGVLSGFVFNVGRRPVLNMFAMKLHCTVTVFASVFCRAVPDCIGDSHHHPVPAFLAIPHEEFFYLTIIDPLLVRVPHSSPPRIKRSSLLRTTSKRRFRFSVFCCRASYDKFLVSLNQRSSTRSSVPQRWPVAVTNGDLFSDTLMIGTYARNINDLVTAFMLSTSPATQSGRFPAPAEAPLARYLHSEHHFDRAG